MAGFHIHLAVEAFIERVSNINLSDYKEKYCIFMCISSYVLKCLYNLYL